MKNRFNFLGMVFLFPLLHVSTVIAQNDKDPYNLLFRLEKGRALSWTAMNQLPIGVDSTEFIHGKYPFQWWGGFQQKPAKWWLSIYGVLTQRISLPVIKSDTLMLELHNKTHNVEWANVFVTSYGEHEDFLRKDTMNILSPEKWKTHILKIPCRFTRLVDIYISSIGINDKSKAYKDFYQYIDLDEMKLKIDSKDLNSCTNDTSIKQRSHFQFIQEHIYPISKDDHRAYYQLQEKKIVGFGETMHNNAGINQTVFDFCKYQIVHNNARILFLECPYHLGFKLNWYITCDKPTQKIKDSLKEDFKYAYSESFFEFLDWLKDLNLNRERKVLIVGMDRLVGKNYFKNPLVEVLLCLTIPANNALQVTKIINLLNRYQNEQAFEEINQNKELIISLLGELNGQMFINYAKRLSKEFPSKLVDKQLIDLYNSQDVFFSRDDAMFRHVCEGIDMYLDPNETALIYGHLGHIERGQEIYPYRNLGYQLEQKYKKDYFPIGITIGKGETTAYELSGKRKQLILPLATPTESSMEHAAMRLSYSSFFYLLQENNKTIAQIRDIMTTNNLDLYLANAQFRFISPKTRMDGLIFIKESSL